MERRISKRNAIDVNVYVSLPGQPTLRCAASDISATGIFLKANPLFLPRHKPLNLLFAVHTQSSNVVRIRRLSAVVTRSQADGVGMMFCRHNLSRRRSAS